MANYTRTNGANARAPEWDDFEEEGQSQRTGTWLPLDALQDEQYFPGPLRPVQAPSGQSRVQSQESRSGPKRPRSKDPALKAGRARVLALFAGGALCMLAAYA